MGNNETDLYLEHIAEEEHENKKCVIVKRYRKTIHRCKVYVYKRKCRCERALPRKKFPHRNKNCHYGTFKQGQYFIVKEFCYCSTEGMSISSGI